MERNAKKKIIFLFLFLIPIVQALNISTTDYDIRFNIGQGAYKVETADYIVRFSVVKEPIENINTTDYLIYWGFFSPLIPAVAVPAGDETVGYEGIDYGETINFTAKVPDLWLINKTTNITINARDERNRLLLISNITFDFEPENNFTLIDTKKFTNGDNIYTFLTEEGTIEQEYNVTITMETISQKYNFIVAEDTKINKLILKWRELKRLKYLLLVGGIVGVIITSSGLFILLMRRKKKKEAEE